MIPIWSQETYLKALHFAAEAHTGQLYAKDSAKPYVIHACMVCAEVMAALCNETTANPNLAVQCALLHDVLEDTPVSLAQLEQVFGLEVARGVQALSKDKTLAKDQQMPESLWRIKEQPQEVWMVKLADRITNLQPPPASWTKDKISDYKAEAAIILHKLAPASPFLAQRLAQKIEAYTVFE